MVLEQKLLIYKPDVYNEFGSSNTNYLIDLKLPIFASLVIVFLLLITFFIYTKMKAKK